MTTITYQHVQELYQQALLDLVYQARTIHQRTFGNEIELCRLVSIKTGGCTEDCAYCAQSNHHQSEIKLNPLLPLTTIKPIIAKAAKDGVKRICMGAAYKSPTSAAIKRVIEYIDIIKEYGLESCATLGNLTKEQACELKTAGLDYYNHNIDTSAEYYPQIVTTHSFAERIDTINNVAKAGIKVCCGGILGMGESQQDRIGFIYALTTLDTAPQSIPINTLVKIAGTKLANVEDLDKLELVRVIACVRILFPQSRIRLAAGRQELSDLEQSMCFLAGVNSIFYGEKLLTTENNSTDNDQRLIKHLAKLSLGQAQ